MAKTVFEAGDVVRLKSGGDKMTIRSIDKHEATCMWFPVVSVFDTIAGENRLYANEPQVKEFHLDTLESA